MHRVGSHLPSRTSVTCPTMKRTVRVFFFSSLVFRHAVGEPEVNVLSELPFNELLARKRIVEEGHPQLPEASALVEPPPARDVSFKGLHKLPHRKTFYDEDYDDGKGHVHKKKEEHKMHDILNTSIMALSYLAFGGYLLCMIASALREKRRRIMMAYPTTSTALNGQFAHVLQHHMTHRPSRPFIRFPAVTVHQGGKKRRRRSTQKEAPWGEARESPLLFDIIDYVDILAGEGN